MEMITNPSILFLDEPTSGLDTYNAYKVARIMRSLGHQFGRTVVATIHQPSSEVFQQFDDLIVLAEGEVMYHGAAQVQYTVLAILQQQAVLSCAWWHRDICCRAALGACMGHRATWLVAFRACSMHAPARFVVVCLCA
jgi:energy-coupling factor transporter ATP-binding protein EcfA2